MDKTKLRDPPMPLGIIISKLKTLLQNELVDTSFYREIREEFPLANKRLQVLSIRVLKTEICIRK